jgi:hypothetical protein
MAVPIELELELLELELLELEPPVSPASKLLMKISSGTLLELDELELELELLELDEPPGKSRQALILPTPVLANTNARTSVPGRAVYG